MHAKNNIRWALGGLRGSKSDGERGPGSQLPSPGRKMDIACFFWKVLQTSYFDEIFVSPNEIFWNANSVELKMATNAMFNSLERSISSKNAHLS